MILDHTHLKPIPNHTTLALWCVALVACGPPRTGSDIHVDALLQLVAQAGLRIGDFDDPSVGFSRVRGVDVDRDGNVYVGEALVPEIRVYGSDGALVRRIGRRGAGPGEFEGMPRFGVIGDTVWALSYHPGRITLFDREGELLSARRVDDVVVKLPAAYAYLGPRTIRPDGNFVGHIVGVASNRNSPDTGVEPTDRIPVPFVLFDATGAALDTIGWAPRPPPRMWHPPQPGEEPIKFIEVGGQRRVVPSAHLTLPWWLPLPDGYILVDAPQARSPEDGTFTVMRFGLQGDTVYARTVHYHPIRYTSADLDSIAAWGARGEPRGMLPVYMPGAPVPDDWEVIAHRLRDAMDFPEFKASLEYPWLAQDGSVWLRLPGENVNTVRWVILDPEGTPRGEFELPANVSIQWSRGNVFWAVQPDESDVPWVVRFEIGPSERLR